MKPDPTISVIIPSFNQGEFLAKCIESILAQNYSALELIIIDGKSTDNSVDIIHRYGPQINHWVSEPDFGQSNAINKGFVKSTGELVTWLNADDFYLPGALAEVAKAYGNNAEAPFYFGDGLRVDRHGQTTASFFPKGVVEFDRQALVLGMNYILQPSSLINRKYVHSSNLLDENLHYGMDWDLWLRLSGLGVPMAIDKPLSASREYATTKTSTGSFERVEELRRIIAKQSGFEITPGIVCYFLDTFYRYIEQNESPFPTSYATEVLNFWAKTSEILNSFGVRQDGFPQHTGASRSMNR